MITLPAPAGQLDWLAFGPDAAWLAAGGSPGLHFWDLTDPARPPTPHRDPVGFGGLAVHPGGRWVYLWGYRVLDRKAGKVYSLGLESHGFHFPLAVSPDTGLVIASGHNPTGEWTGGGPPDWMVCYRQPAARPPAVEWSRQRRPRQGDPYLLAFLPRGGRFAAAEFVHRKGERLTQLAVRDAGDGEYYATTDCPTYADQLLPSPGGSRLVVRTGTKLTVYDLADLDRKPAVVKGDARNHWDGTGAAFHPSGRALLLADPVAGVRVLDPETWAVARTFAWDVGAARSVAVSADGTLAAAAGDGGRVVVWDWDG